MLATADLPGQGHVAAVIVQGGLADTIIELLHRSFAQSGDPAESLKGAGREFARAPQLHGLQLLSEAVRLLRGILLICPQALLRLCRLPLPADLSRREHAPRAMALADNARSVHLLYWCAWHMLTGQRCVFGP